MILELAKAEPANLVTRLFDDDSDEKMEAQRVANIYCILVLGAVLCLTGTALAAQPDVVDNQQTGRATGRDQRANVQLASFKLFNFERFTQVFGRTYGSVLEYSARCRIYLARAYQAFLSLLGFKQGWRTSYQAPTRLSDRTPEELRDNFPYTGENGEFAREQLSEEPLPAADMSQIERQLSQTGPSSDLNRLIVDELRPSERRKRSASAQSDLKIDDLARDPSRLEPDPPEVRAKLSLLLDSNNLHYQAPILLSQGDEESERGQPAALSPSEASRVIDQSSMGEFVSSIMRSAASQLTSYLYSAPADDEEDLLVEDRRRDSCLLQVRDQGDCGCCGAFATMALLEWAYCRKTGKLVSFSEQYPLDCGRPQEGLLGCQGGSIKSTLNFVNNYGLELALNYPFKEFSEGCPYDQDAESIHMGFLRLDAPITYKLIKPNKSGIVAGRLEKVLSHRPMIAGVKVVVSDFIQYADGVDEPSCEQNTLGHAMLLIGHGRQDGRPYWLFRNSFGLSWGQHGHYKLSKQSPCLIYALDVAADFGHNQNPHYNFLPLASRHSKYLSLN